MAFFFLFVMFGLTMTDYLSRGVKTYPGGAGGQFPAFFFKRTRVPRDRLPSTADRAARCPVVGGRA